MNIHHQVFFEFERWEGEVETGLLRKGVDLNDIHP